MAGDNLMRSKRMRVLMPSTSGRDYVTTAQIHKSGRDVVEITNISGMPEDLILGVSPERIIGKKRSGRRARRMKGGRA